MFLNKGTFVFQNQVISIPLRSLALPIGLPFSFATFLGLPRFLSGGKQKKSRDAKQMLGC
jgi:hypothetical protein